MICKSILRALCSAALAVFAFGAVAHAQEEEPPAPPKSFEEDMARAGIRFDEWLAAGEIEQIKWEVEILPAWLDFDQRLRMTIFGEVQRLDRSRTRREFHIVMRVRSPGGTWFPSYSHVRQDVPEDVPSETGMSFSIRFYTKPGKYEMALLLFDAVSRARSLVRRDFIVSPLKKDPLPNADRDLPGIEFLGENLGSSFDLRGSIWLDFSYGESGRLWLPVKARRPVRVDVLVNLSPTERIEWAGARRYTYSKVLDTLKALADLRIENGTLNVTAVHLTRREVVFEQRVSQGLDWKALADAVKKVNKPLIEADMLSGREHNPTFFREVVQRLLAANDGEASPHVIIVVSEPIRFARGADVKPLEVGNAELFYIRCSWLEFDELDRMMRPNRKRFYIRTEMDLRRALRKIIDEIEKL